MPVETPRIRFFFHAPRINVLWLPVVLHIFHRRSGPPESGEERDRGRSGGQRAHPVISARQSCRATVASRGSQLTTSPLIAMDLSRVFLISFFSPSNFSHTYLQIVDRAGAM